jgi:hypothetical protein
MVFLVLHKSAAKWPPVLPYCAKVLQLSTSPDFKPVFNH